MGDQDDDLEVTNGESTEDDGLTVAQREEIADEMANRDLGHSLGRDGLPETFSVDDLEFLSKPEREELDAMRAEESEDDSKQDDDAGEDKPDQGSKAKPAQQDDAGRSEAANPEKQEDRGEDPKIPPAPDFTEHEKKIQQVDTQIRELRASYEQADLSDEEFDEKLMALVDQKADLKAEVRSVTKETEDQRQQVLDQWFSRVDQYLEANPDLKSDEHLRGFDEALRAVTGSERYAGLSWDAQMQLAHRFYADESEVLGRPVAGPKKAEQRREESADPGERQEKQMQQRTDPRPAPPRTLSGVPASGTQSALESKATSLDRIIDEDPYAAEDMMANMSPDELQRLLTGA